MTDAQVQTPSAPKSGVIHPPRPLHRKYVEPILYLAERMARSDKELAAAERRVVDVLAKHAGLKDFRAKSWYRELSDVTACKRLDIDAAKRGCLVVLTLVLKADIKKKPEEHEYFTRLRMLLGAEPIIVPIDLELHKQLALEYVS